MYRPIPRQAQALAVLAHTYLQYGRAGEAAVLLEALTHVPDVAPWARLAHCLALLCVGRFKEAADGVEALLDQPMDDAARRSLLQVIAKAEWRLGRCDSARGHFAASQQLAVTSLVPPVPAWA